MDIDNLLHQIRYAERLCERTARLYRRLQALALFMAVLGGSGVVSAASGHAPAWVSMTGALVLAIFGAASLVIRPADKAAANESDQRRYAQLRSAAHTMTAQQLAQALAKAHEGDCAEVEALREIAYNDVVSEYGRPDAVIRLGLHQRILGALA